MILHRLLFVRLHCLDQVRELSDNLVMLLLVYQCFYKTQHDVHKVLHKSDHFLWILYRIELQLRIFPKNEENKAKV